MSEGEDYVLPADFDIHVSEFGKISEKITKTIYNILCCHFASILSAIRSFVFCVNTVDFLASRLPEDMDVGDDDVAC